MERATEDLLSVFVELVADNAVASISYTGGTCDTFTASKLNRCETSLSGLESAAKRNHKERNERVDFGDTFLNLVTMIRKRGTGCLYQRGEVWWLKYYVYGEARCESSRTTDRDLAEKLLAARVAGIIPTGEDAIASIVKGLARREDTSQGTVGTVSELIVAAHLLNCGYDVFRSMSPHASCDLVALKGGRTIKIEAKTAEMKSGRIIHPTIRNRGCYDVLALVVRNREIIFDPPLEDHPQ